MPPNRWGEPSSLAPHSCLCRIELLIFITNLTSSPPSSYHPPYHEHPEIKVGTETWALAVRYVHVMTSGAEG